LTSGLALGTTLTRALAYARAAERLSLARLLLVLLDGAPVPHLGGIGVAAVFAGGAALAEKVPALVERRLDLGEAVVVLGRRAVGAFVVEDAVLFADERVDALKDVRVVHGASGACLVHPLNQMGPGR
jgi:hypothetical protein